MIQEIHELHQLRDELMWVRYKDTVSHEVTEPAESTRHDIPQIDATTARSGKSTSWRTPCETLVPCNKDKRGLKTVMTCTKEKRGLETVKMTHGENS